MTQAAAGMTGARFATTSDMLGLLLDLCSWCAGAVPCCGRCRFRSTGLDDIRYVIYQRTASSFPSLRPTFVSALQQSCLDLLANQPNASIHGHLFAFHTDTSLPRQSHGREANSKIYYIQRFTGV
ncbi:protein of unknown function (plasmid) [Cupriavidus neocaledonicus]|uniref:Uncharacterized protein n=1 Tax=Cupriavidus neocaledonicus TaxID=1040979 RepID=A0A375HQA1_9BURK|nr:protein of unknown function [Cupriavidus neocaledonicus]